MGAGQMSDLDDYQRRIAAALDRIGQAMARPAPAQGGDELARLTRALETEKAKSQQLDERLRALKSRDGAASQDFEEKVEVLTRQLDVQGLELQRMRKTTIALREQLRALNEATLNGGAEGAAINKALLAELEALRATRASEAAELDEILSELTPLVQEAVENA
ncbi:hypothetical protein GCM10007315_00470 [Gemmobacter tilapiae]|uniref:Uncharacterized protein n=2 Tax=Neogemmobacter tilapiae TaxID=875041 RepID=A0A918TDQ8_9RHOB|nr:hypothetical protein GCM10007315_00470 [Gemmobacter tilapiae]